MAEPRQAERLNRAKDTATLAASLVAIAVAIVGGVNWLVGLQLDAKLDPLQADVKAIQTDVKTLRADVKAIQTDVKAIQTDVETLQADVETLESDSRTLEDAIDTLASRMVTVDHLEKLKTETLAELKTEFQRGRGLGSTGNPLLPGGSYPEVTSIRLKCQPVSGSSDGLMNCTVDL